LVCFDSIWTKNLDFSGVLDDAVDRNVSPFALGNDKS
jgi:hypothetical protein